MPERPPAESENAIEVHLPYGLLRLFPHAPEALELEAGTVREMIDALDARWPGMADRLRDSRPATRRNINIFVDGRRTELDTPLAPGTTVHIMTAMTGG